ncbi:cyclase family protein [Paenibacillus oryzisoli]|uniref:cyclase family protein n=1 Tax=Paenibacillus oryzisoli TaxID=1850517 RepID=UPI003D29FFD5
MPVYQRLSYLLDAKDPVWPGNPKVEFAQYSSIPKGDTCNEYRITLFNHFGSHMDSQKHVYDNGLTLSDMSIDAFVYDRPLLLDIPKSYGELVTADELRAYETELKQADLLLIRSGFAEKRLVDPQGYSERGPGVSEEACRYLAEECPELKGVALDWLSLSCFMLKEEGLRAHLQLLNPERKVPMVIIEDLTFEGVAADRLRKVTALPLLVAGVDSGPCQVVAELED